MFLAHTYSHQICDLYKSKLFIDCRLAYMPIYQHITGITCFFIISPSYNKLIIGIRYHII